MLISILIFLLILSALVLIHEFGHFYSAKKLGVRVEEFGWGIPPRAWGKKIGETIYSINWLPFGGFVRLFGEDLEGQDVFTNPKSFMAKSVPARAVIILAGIFMNLVLAIGIYYFLLSTNNYQSEPIVLINDHDFRFGQEEGRVVVTGIRPDSPAANADIKQGDVVLRFKEGGGTWVKIIDSDTLITSVKDNKGEVISVELENVANGDKRVVDITPEYDEELERAIIGIALGESVVIKYQESHQKALAGPMHSYNVIAYTFDVMGDLISTSFKEKTVEPVSSGVSGPVGIYSIVDDVVKSSGSKVVRNLLDITGLLSLSLAVMNLLPLPALDGGRFIFILWEGITRKPVNQQIEATVHKIGFILLLTLLILISFKDVLRLF